MEHKIQNENKQNTIQHSKLKGQTRVDDPRDKGNMEHKIQNEDKQNTIQQSKLKVKQEWTTPETTAVWSIRYRTKTSKTIYNKVIPEGENRSGRPQRQRQHGA
jgi:hypothetical protein